ncbi:Pol [Symbiodinium necroappetens]|uniref:Pol protein n=1 Tax=Symbiodinium necroappetens TaxID=1628268 RepID=A0A813C6E2_9DINO|nr:Pol [Symbiodinium necroappetens]
MALRELCFFFLVGHLVLYNPNRRISTAKYAAQRRSRGNQDPGDVYAYVYVQLDEGPAARLDAAYQALANLWNRGVPENNVAWLAYVGSFQDPLKHVRLLHMDRMLRKSLCRHMDERSADHMAGYMVDYVRDLDRPVLHSHPAGTAGPVPAVGRRWTTGVPTMVSGLPDYSRRMLPTEERSSSSRGPAA